MHVIEKIVVVDDAVVVDVVTREMWMNEFACGSKDHCRC